MKYFNALTESQQNKVEIAELIAVQVAHDDETQQYLKEKEKKVSDIYQLRMELSKRISQVEQKSMACKELQLDNDRLT